MEEWPRQRDIGNDLTWDREIGLLETVDYQGGDRTAAGARDAERDFMAFAGKCRRYYT
ncbi:MAG: hypothetical protein ABIR25_05680 [Sphingomicrobium sp.]